MHFAAFVVLYLFFSILDLQKFMYSFMDTLTDLRRGSMLNQWFQTGQSWCHFPQSCWTKTSTTKSFTNYQVLKTMKEFWFFKNHRYFFKKMIIGVMEYLLIWVQSLHQSFIILAHPPHDTVIRCLCWCFLVYYFCHTPYRHLV